MGHYHNVIKATQKSGRKANREAGKSMAAKNPAAKMRKPAQPYAQWTDNATGWKYKLLKAWQGRSMQPYARWLMLVEGWSTDMGDTYVAEMYPGLIWSTDLTVDTTVWADAKAFLQWVKGE